MKKAFLILPFLILLIAGCSGSSRTWDRIQDTGLLRVGVDPTFPPFELLEGNDFSGLDIDLAEALASDLGLNAQFQPYSYDALYDALASGQVDVLISALVIEPEKARDFAYSRPYFNAGEVLVVQVNSPVQEMTDLNGRILAVELGARGHVTAADWAARLPDLTIMTYETSADALTAVLKGKADAALVDGISGRLFIKEAAELKLTPEAVNVEPYALVVRIDDARLLDNLNRSLESLRANGQFQKIMTNWLGN